MADEQAPQQQHQRLRQPSAPAPSGSIGDGIRATAAPGHSGPPAWTREVRVLRAGKARRTGEARQAQLRAQEEGMPLLRRQGRLHRLQKVGCLGSFIQERGKILPRRMTGTCARHQRWLTVAIKRAQNIALLPFAAEL